MDTRLGQPATGEAPYERAPVIAGSMQGPDLWHDDPLKKLAPGLKPDDHWMMNAQLERDNRLRIAMLDNSERPTLRDQFAMAALSALGLCEHYRMDDLNHMAYVVYAMADSMMKARK